MATKKINKLNSGIITSLHALKFTQKKIIIDIYNKDYEVLLDEKFSIVKLQTLMCEFIENFKYLQDASYGVKINYYMFLIIKYFSDIDITKTESFEDQIKALNAFIDLEIFEKISNAFQPEEVTKAFEFIKKFADRVEQFVKENKNVDEIKEILKDEINKSENID
jgi:hypothetical protein